MIRTIEELRPEEKAIALLQGVDDRSYFDVETKKVYTIDNIMNSMKRKIELGIIEDANKK